MKKYRECPAADLKLPLVKNYHTGKVHMELLRKRTVRVGKLRIINMSILWLLLCSNNNEVLKIKVNTPILLPEGLMGIKNLKMEGR